MAASNLAALQLGGLGAGRKGAAESLKRLEALYERAGAARWGWGWGREEGRVGLGAAQGQRCMACMFAGLAPVCRGVHARACA